MVKNTNKQNLKFSGEVEEIYLKAWRERERMSVQFLQKGKWVFIGENKVVMFQVFLDSSYFIIGTH